MTGWIDWGFYFRGRDAPVHLDRENGEKIENRAYFGPTHIEMLRKGQPSFIQDHSNVSAVMDEIAHLVLWEAGVYEDRERGGVFVVVPGSEGSQKQYMRISLNDTSGKMEFELSHCCEDCRDLHGGGRGACKYIIVAVAAFEAVRKGNSPVKKLARIALKSCRPDCVNTGRQETTYIRLMDELYYSARYRLDLENRLLMNNDCVPRATFERCRGSRLVISEKKSPVEQVEDGVDNGGKEEFDWKKLRVRRRLNARERALVPRATFYLEQNGEEKLAARVVHAKDPLLIVGPAGVGKSRLARKVFERLRLPLLVISASSDRDLYSLVASTGLKKGETCEVPAKILTGSRMGYGLLIDEIASLRPDRAMFLNSILQEREIDLGTETVRLHEDCRIVATCNEGDEFIGSTGLDPSTLDRFVSIYLGYTSEDIEMDVVAHESGSGDRETIRRMIRVGDKVRRLYEHGEMSRPVTTRDIIRWARYSEGSDPLEIAGHILVPSVAKDPEERMALEDLLEEVFLY